MAQRRFRADLHIHSCLSPCGELSNSPRAIVERALAVGLDIIALTDHNTAENAEAALRAAAGTGLTVLPGMEVTSEEEVHILGLFPTMDDIRPAQQEVARHLPKIPAKKSFVRDQVIVDEHDEVTGFNRQCLFAATGMDVYAVIALIHQGNGLAIASHIDKDAFSLISQLGFIPPDLELDALEVSPFMTVDKARAMFKPKAALPVVRFSDAHQPGDIGRTFTDLLIAAPSFEEVRMAFRAEKGRRVVVP
jgi:PHP family Zn ribbon phosphoesterase